ncbi:hypothetical protein DET49_104166 [Salegentibacter sp. 24]|uniref:hypothetical protein n=1 Tax=Salegentibacter sp. 24 TaxID=2183986 RepID=UPI001061918E|nr:hypothetical protein [Salegentibacter sp. 24]TDN93435.1 hypothetical protein DET49_104166 [Salegentibacter sp. 24]
MKSFFKLHLAPYVMIFCLLVGCNEDAVDQGQEEEFIKAQINGEAFLVDRARGIISCQKHLNDYGGIDLVVNVETMEGEIMSFHISDYTGPKNYIFGNNVFNKSWIRYGVLNSPGDWYAMVENKQVQTILPYIEILKDNGNYINGNFEFEAHNTIDNSIKMVRDGNFNFKIASELE